MRNPFKKILPRAEQMILPPAQRIEMLRAEIEKEAQRAWNSLQDIKAAGKFELEIPLPAKTIVIRYELRYEKTT